nr:unnamed protein product [Callosobruchus analis]
MTSKFKCCKNKDALYYICVSCFGVFHHSCSNRMRNIVKVSGNKIYCSSECELQGNQIISLDESSETAERLKQELHDKEKHIERLLKRAKDFENDVLEIEQRFIDEQTEYKEQLKIQKEKVYSLKNEIISTQNVNDKLTEKIDDYQNQIEKMSKQINELQKVNVEMLSSEKSTIVHDSANEIDEFSRTEKDNSDNNTDFLPVQPSLVNNISKKRRVLVIGDEFAKNGSSVLHSIISSPDITIEGIVKPGLEFSDLALSLFYHSQQYGKNDYIIIMVSTINISNLKQLNLALRHLLPLSKLTNLFIMSKRSQFDDFRVENYLLKTVNRFFIKNYNISLRFKPNVIHSKAMLRLLAKEIVEYTHHSNIVLKVIEPSQSFRFFRGQDESN